MEKFLENDVHNSRVVFRVCAAVGLIVVAGAYLGAGYYGSSKMIDVTSQRVEYDQTVLAVDGDRYTLQGSAYDIDGLVGGVQTDASHAGIFGPPLDMDTKSKISMRHLREPSGALPKVNDRVSLQGNIWTSNPKEALGLDYEDVTYRGPLGAMSAWMVPAKESKSWIIGVHGDGAPKSELLRFIKPLHCAGYNFLAINYRNDIGNPASPDGYKHLGDTEWEDLRAAVIFAKQRGAEDIHLAGLSIGGSIIQNYLRRAPEEETARIGKVMLDSPVMDWNDLVTYRLDSQGYWGILAHPTKTMARIRAGLDLGRISTSPGSIRHKTLVIHSADDRNVPFGPSKKVAEAQPDLVAFYDLRGGHTRGWNHDPSYYEQIMTGFFRK